MNNAYAVVFKIENGYIVTEVVGDRTIYLKDFSLDALINSTLPVDHEAMLAEIVFKTPADKKIHAIKDVRNYCIDKNYDKYCGLKDAKDYVERIRTDWYRSTPSGPLSVTG